MRLEPISSALNTKPDCLENIPLTLCCFSQTHQPHCRKWTDPSVPKSHSGSKCQRVRIQGRNFCRGIDGGVVPSGGFGCNPQLLGRSTCPMAPLPGAVWWGEGGGAEEVGFGSSNPWKGTWLWKCPRYFNFSSLVMLAALHQRY